MPNSGDYILTTLVLILARQMFGIGELTPAQLKKAVEAIQHQHVPIQGLFGGRVF